MDECGDIPCNMYCKMKTEESDQGLRGEWHTDIYLRVRLRVALTCVP